MKVVISDVLKTSFTEFVVVQKFIDVRSYDGVTTLIIHHFAEASLDVGMFISEFRKKGIQQFLYISAEPEAVLEIMIKSVGGLVLRDEFYLEDEEELSILLDGYDDMVADQSGTELATTEVTVVKNFIGAFARGESRINTPIYLERVNQAITDLATRSQEQETRLAALGSGTISVFERASNVIKTINEQRKQLEQKLSEAETAFSVTPTKAAFANNIQFFSPVKYMGNSKILLIREYAPCRYLTSFALGYLHHLHYELNKRPKLIFVHQKGQGVQLKYKAFYCITQESMNIDSLYDGEIIATNIPKNEVMNGLLGRHNDVIVVVDRLYGSQDILSGRINKINAVGSRSDIERYGCNPEDTIFSVTSQAKQLFTLQTIKNFPVEEDARYATYSQIMSGAYGKLDKRLGLKEDN